MPLQVGAFTSERARVVVYCERDVKQRHGVFDALGA